LVINLVPIKALASNKRIFLCLKFLPQFSDLIGLVISSGYAKTKANSNFLCFSYLALLHVNFCGFLTPSR